MRFSTKLKSTLGRGNGGPTCQVVCHQIYGFMLEKQLDISPHCAHRGFRGRGQSLPQYPELEFRVQSLFEPTNGKPTKLAL